jgi:hypothetical protein
MSISWLEAFCSRVAADADLRLTGINSWADALMHGFGAAGAAAEA